MRKTTTYGLTALLLITLTTATQAYDNSTSTGPYLKLTNGDPIHAIHDANTAAWGQWFWVILACGIYGAMWRDQRTFHLAQIWMITILAAYGHLLNGFNHIFFIMAGFWLMSILVRLLSPWYTN